MDSFMITEINRDGDNVYKIHFLAGTNLAVSKILN